MAIAFGELDADRPLGVEQPEQRRLFGMVGLGGIARRRADAAIGLGDQILGRESLVGRIAPKLAPHARVHRLGEGFRQPVAERLDQDRRIVVVGVLEALAIASSSTPAVTTKPPT